MTKHSSTKNNPTADLIGGGLSGVIGASIFHPCDTAIKRQQAAKKSPDKGLIQAIFKDKIGFAPKALTLYDGLIAGGVYKVIQSGYRFGSQPTVNRFVDKQIGSSLRDNFNDRQVKLMTQALAGMMVGFGEPFFTLPFDAMKVRLQTNKEATKGMNYAAIFRSEGMALFNGISWTITRNVIGSGLQFGINALVKDVIFHLDNQNASFLQNLTASGIATTLMIAASNPPDVIKTRIQKEGKEGNKTGRAILSELLRKEGSSVLFRGTTLKVLTKSPQASFVFALAQTIASKLSG